LRGGAGGRPPAPPPIALNDDSHVDMMGPRYKSADFKTEARPVCVDLQAGGLARLQET